MNSLVFSKGGEHFELFSFLAEALPSGDSGCPWEVIRAEQEGSDKIFTATDGKRLHQCVLTGDSLLLEPGDYSVVKRSGVVALTRVEDIKDYPNWRNMLPRKKVLLYQDFFIRKNCMEDPVYMLYGLDIMVSLDFLKALGGFSWDVYQGRGGRMKPVIFERDKVQAVIAPQLITSGDQVEMARERIREAMEEEGGLV
jgi:hypothetical protein